MVSAIPKAGDDEATTTSSTPTTLSREHHDSEHLNGGNDGEAMQECMSETKSSLGSEPPSKKSHDHVVESEAVLSQEDKAAERATQGQDLEALHSVASGPAYTVFTPRQRQFIVYMVACAAFFSPLSANIYFPALTQLSQDLHVSNSLTNLSLTSYMIFQGLAPTIFGDLADMTGRRPTLILGFVIYIGANIGLALQDNYAALLVLRCLQSTGSSGTVALANGIVADIASSGERGKFMGV